MARMGSSPFQGSSAFLATPKTGVSFSGDRDRERSMHSDEHDPLKSSSSEMYALRSIQTARAVVASERQRLHSRSQFLSERDARDTGSPEPAKRASEEALFEEMSLMINERDLLVREKSALQAILASSADEIRRLFDGEQKHVGEMKAWLAQKEGLEQDKEEAHALLKDLHAEVDALRKNGEELREDKQSLEKTQIGLARDVEELQDRLGAAHQELSIRRTAEQQHREERREWMQTQDEYVRDLTHAQAEVSQQGQALDTLREQATEHQRKAEAWGVERTALIEVRVERDRLQIEAAEHRAAEVRWGEREERILRERSDAVAQV
ncbi:hypothetical protein T484DRAFT_3611624, partial [Baffinella frigidus]